MTVLGLLIRTSDIGPLKLAMSERARKDRAYRLRPNGNHIFERHGGDWHRDWDRRHAHFRNGHWWFFDGGTWIGLDAGYPWNYYPYSAADQQADPTVSAVQSRLATLGYYHGVVDGLFDPDTRAALKRYQIDHRLSVTASITKDTLQSLGIQKIATS